MLDESQDRPPAYYIYNKPLQTGKKKQQPKGDMSSRMHHKEGESKRSDKSHHRRKSVHESSTDKVHILSEHLYEKSEPLVMVNKTPYLMLDAPDMRANRPFKDTGFTFKTAVNTREFVAT